MLSSLTRDQFDARMALVSANVDKLTSVLGILIAIAPANLAKPIFLIRSAPSCRKRYVMPHLLKAVLASFVLTATLSSTGISQTHYRCKTPSGGTIFSDVPCPSGTRQEQATYVSPQVHQQPTQAEYPAAKTSDARMLDNKVAEAIGSGDFSRAKGLALTAEHWKMIADAEQRIRQPVTGRTDADLRAELKNSRECKEAQQSYDVEASSIRKDAAQINAAKRRMYSACGMNEPNVTDNRTVIIDNRSVAPAPAPRSMRCQQRGNGQMDCW